MDKIRNFSIIAHIDHGKSTLADRMLEITGTVEKRRMKDQLLDSMELERERGITIKMQPVRMQFAGHELNLIDTPGHIDFSYEVSRSLRAVEGAVLLIDATQGIQAQTLTTLSMAKESGLVIIPAISKIDSPFARVEEVKEEIVKNLGCKPDEIILTSGKTGDGVADLLSHIIKHVPAPKRELENDNTFRGLVFDFEYSMHRGVVVYVRVMNGSVKKGDSLSFLGADRDFIANEVGIFSPQEVPVDSISVGETGYIVTGIKEEHIASVGDTVSVKGSKIPPLPGYMQPQPVVWASVYPESQDNFTLLRQALSRLKLTDASLSFEEELSGILGRGFRCGFLGMLHLEIITERLKREFGMSLIVTNPTIAYEVTTRNGKIETIYSPSLFPDDGMITSIREPWAKVSIITPEKYVGQLVQILYEHEAVMGDTSTFSDIRVAFEARIPLRELMRSFFDKVKSATSGFASLSYDIVGLEPADVVRLDILVAEEPVPAFARVVSRRKVAEEAELIVEKLHSLLPKQLFVTKIQAKAVGRILASRTLSALKKDVTGYLYGGDITRKRKLWEKQKRGKKKLQANAKVNISQDIFLKMMRND